MEITMTRSTQTTSSSRVDMPACGHASRQESALTQIGEFGQIFGNVAGNAVRDRDVAAKGALALVPAYTRGTPAWSPPLS